MGVSLNVGLFSDFAISFSCRSDTVLTFEELVSNRMCTSIKGLSCQRNESPRVRTGALVKDLVISLELMISEKLGFSAGAAASSSSFDLYSFSARRI